MPNVEPYLLWNEIEIVNGLRTLSYLRAGLGGAEWDVELQSPRPVGEGEGYSDFYSDLYGADRFAVPNLACYCSVYDGGPYARPSYDPAPWYDADRPESADFLGFWPDVQMLNPALRAVTARSSGGGTVSPFNPGPRTVQVAGRMYAASVAGMAYGERWLTAILSGSDDCDGDTLTLLPCCPPDGVDDPTSYMRELAAVALIDGPTFSDIGVKRSIAQGVAFQLAAGEPYLRRTVEIGVLDPTHGTGIGDIDGPPLMGDAALVLSFTGPVTLDVTAHDGGIGGPVIGTFSVAMDGSGTLVYDASRQTVTQSDGTSGLDALDFDGLLPWFVAGAGHHLTLVIEGDGSVGVSAVYREL